MNIQIINIEGVLYDLYLDSRDKINIKDVIVTFQDYSNKGEKEFFILVKYKKAPIIGARTDGEVRSWIIPHYHDLDNLTTRGESLFLILDHIISKTDWDISVLQIREGSSNLNVLLQFNQKMDFIWVVPHCGDEKYLIECLPRILRQKELIANNEVTVCFDDKLPCKALFNKYTKSNISFKKLRIIGVGPYVARQLSIENSTKEFIAFQDSDDIPSVKRFITSANALENKQIDAVGSHEIRIDYLKSKVLAIRYPLDVTAALEKRVSHSLLFPTMVIRRTAFQKAEGFSTNLKFGLDTQFLLRAYFSCKFINVDEFLYIKRNRPRSLTTSKSTALGSPVREHFSLLWAQDFELIKRGIIPLSGSSLQISRGNEYRNNMLTTAW